LSEGEQFASEGWLYMDKGQHPQAKDAAPLRPRARQLPSELAPSMGQIQSFDIAISNARFAARLHGAHL